MAFLQILFILGVYWAGADIASAFQVCECDILFHMPTYHLFELPLQPLIPVWTAVLAYLTCIEKLPSASLVSIAAVFIVGWLSSFRCDDVTLIYYSCTHGRNLVLSYWLQVRS